MTDSLLAAHNPNHACFTLYPGEPIQIKQNGSSTTEQSRGASATAMWAGCGRIRNRSFWFPPSHSPSGVPESLRSLHRLSFQAGSAAMFESRSLSSKDPWHVTILTLKLDSLSRAGVKCREPHWGPGPAHTCRDRWFLMPRSPVRIRVRQKKRAFPWWAISDSARHILWIPHGSQRKVSIQKQKRRLFWDLPATANRSYAGKGPDSHRYKSVRLHWHHSSARSL